MCRYTCCLIFMISCMDEVVKIFRMLQLFYQIPTKAEPWIRPRLLAEGRITGDIDDVRLSIAGMPFKWKITNMVAVIIPKFCLWTLTVETGITFLMETASIDNLIVNSVALALILGIDELILSSLMHEEVSEMLHVTEDYALYDIQDSCVGDISRLSEDDLLDSYMEEQLDFRSLSFQDVFAFLPTKLILALVFNAIFIEEYYWRHCTKENQDGVVRWVSKPMYLPLSTAYHWWNAFLPRFFPIETEPEPYWVMPGI